MTRLHTDFKNNSKTIILFLTLLGESSWNEFEEVVAIIFLQLSQTNREMVAWLWSLGRKSDIGNWFRNFWEIYLGRCRYAERKTRLVNIKKKTCG